MKSGKTSQKNRNSLNLAQLSSNQMHKAVLGVRMRDDEEQAEEPTDEAAA